jgi:chorismate mutase
MTIDEIRQEIDRLDSELLRIFNQRMKEENPGPLDNQAIVRLFERVIDESRRLERIMTSREE